MEKDCNLITKSPYIPEDKARGLATGDGKIDNIKKIFPEAVACYNAFPYGQEIYCLWDNKNDAYVYLQFGGFDILPFFYDKKMASAFLGEKGDISGKQLSYGKVKALIKYYHEQVADMYVVFFTATDRREFGYPGMHERAFMQKKYIHILIDRNIDKNPFELEIEREWANVY